MSLEKAIAENTAAIRELITVMSGARVAVPTEQVSPPVIVVDGSPDAELDFVKDVQPLINDLVANGKKQAAVDIAKKLVGPGVKISTMAKSQYPEAIRLLKAALA